MSSDFALPSSLATDKNYLALNRLLDRLDSLDLTRLLVYWLDDVDASALPHLAAQFHILGLEGWDYAVTEADKRSLLKQAVELHRYKGTPWAVRQGMRRVHPDIDLAEWYEYGGKPYFFKIRYNGADVSLSLSQALKLYYIIDALKSLRSRLEGGIEATENVAYDLKIATHYVFSVLYDTDALELANAGAVVMAGTHTRTEAGTESVGIMSPYINPIKIYVDNVTRIEVSR